jgi:hypothetical protein
VKLRVNADAYAASKRAQRDVAMIDGQRLASRPLDLDLRC